jgi:hypothetical protein
MELEVQLPLGEMLSSELAHAISPSTGTSSSTSLAIREGDDEALPSLFKSGAAPRQACLT